MSSKSARLCYLMSEAHKADDLASAREAYKEWQASQCYHPHKQTIVDGHTGQIREIVVPCGKCYHCRETHINEWVTRMYAHLEDFKNVYFVTLTYRSYDTHLRDVSRLMLDRLSQAVWHADAYNETKHLAYSPTLLCKDHYQKFLKRLRKNTGINDLTYCIAGEYGKKFGRPHFHLILFSNSEISKQDIDRAWSVALFHDGQQWKYKTNQRNGKTRYFSIGRTQVDDLVRNGTLNTAVKVKVDGNYMNAAHCFAYVCKYVCKNNDYNKMRVEIAYRSLWKQKQFVSLFNNEVSLEKAKQWLYDRNCRPEESYLQNQLKKLTYEKTLFQPSPTIWSGNLKHETFVKVSDISFCRQLVPTLEVENGQIKTQIFASVRFAFVEQFAPFVEFSRGTPIGSVYAKRHLQEFTQGVFNRPLMQTQSFVVPRYFFDKAAEFLYGLRCVHSTIKGVSYTLSNIPNLYGQFQKYLKTDASPVCVLYDSDYHQNLGQLVKSGHAFYDKHTGEHIILLKYGDFIRVEMFKYDRSLRSYYITRSMNLGDWLSSWLDRIDQEQLRYMTKFSRTQESVRLQERAFLIATDLGFDLATEQNLYETNQNEYLANRQKIYDEVHSSAE